MNALSTTLVHLFACLSAVALIAGCPDGRIRSVNPDGSQSGLNPEDYPRPIVPLKDEVIGDDLKALLAESKVIASLGYVFMPGDLIEITVFEYPELKSRVRVPRDKEISFPMIGKIQLGGFSIKELEHEIRAKLENGFVTKAQVSVLPVEFAERNVYIFGNVKTSGSFKIPPMGNLSIVQLVSLAGGFTEDADRRNIILIREDQVGVRTTYKIPFIAVEKLGNVDLDVFLKAGDRIMVSTEQKVYVLGSVNQPGGFSVGQQGLTASKAVALARGFTRLAAPNSTIVIRENKDGSKTTFKVPLSSILELGNDELDLILNPGDVIYVPESLF